MPFDFPLEKYLSRLSLSRPPLSAAGLSALHKAQVFSLPFENIEPFLGRPVSLAPASLAEKFLVLGRGGYCFELNSFFLHAISHLGFEAHPKLGRVFMGRPVAGPRTHQVSLVKIEGKDWLADVGFGGPGLVEPIPFVDGFKGVQQGREIRLRQSQEWGMLLEEQHEGAWRIIYALPEERAQEIDFEVGNHYCASHSQSTFRTNFYCTLHREQGKITAFNRVVNGSGAVKSLDSPGQIGAFFQEIGLLVTEADIQALHKKLPL